MKDSKAHLVAGSNHWLVQKLIQETEKKAKSGKPVLVYELPLEIAAETLVKTVEEVMNYIYESLLNVYLRKGLTNATQEYDGVMNFTLIYEHPIGNFSLEIAS